MYVIPRINLIQRRERAVADVFTAFSLCHPHITTVSDVVATPSFLCLVSEHAAGATLAAYVRQRGHLAERVAKFLFQQLSMVLAFCAGRGVALPHLTPDTVVVDWAPGRLPVLKLADCGFAAGAQVPHGWTREHAGAVSAWSAGCLLHFMLFGRPPPPAAAAGAAWRPSVFLREMRGRAADAAAWLPTRNSHGVLSDGALATLRALLCDAGGASGHLDAVIASPWLQDALPRGIAKANAICDHLSSARAKSALAARVRETVAKALQLPPRGYVRIAAVAGQEPLFAKMEEIQAVALARCVARGGSLREHTASVRAGSPPGAADAAAVSADAAGAGLSDESAPPAPGCSAAERRPVKRGRRAAAAPHGATAAKKPKAAPLVRTLSPLSAAALGVPTATQCPAC